MSKKRRIRRRRRQQALHWIAPALDPFEISHEEILADLDPDWFQVAEEAVDAESDGKAA